MNNNSEFIKALEEIREHDRQAGTTIEATAHKIMQAFAVYGDPEADTSEMRVRNMDAIAGICDLAAACSNFNVLSSAQDYLITETAKERRRQSRRSARNTLTLTFMQKWADDLEASGKAKTRAEAVLMAAEAYSDLSQRAAGQDTGGF